MSITVNGTNGLTFNDASTQNTAASGFGFKNRIINGDMRIAQRGASFTAPGTITYTLDRWLTVWGGTSPTVAQIAGPTGFKNALQLTGIAANTGAYAMQRIESYNCTDLVGQSVAINANLQASAVLTVAWILYYANGIDNWAGGYTAISSGTWSVSTSAASFSATVSSLPASAANGLMLAISPNSQGAFTSGTLNITGVQLEKGSTATSFDYRPYGAELVLCQRYYENGYLGAMFSYDTTTNGRAISIPFKATKRAAPTVTKTGGFSLLGGGFSIDAGGDAPNAGQFSLFTAAAGAVREAGINWKASSEL